MKSNNFLSGKGVEGPSSSFDPASINIDIQQTSLHKSEKHKEKPQNANWKTLLRACLVCCCTVLFTLKSKPIINEHMLSRIKQKIISLNQIMISIEVTAM